MDLDQARKDCQEIDSDDPRGVEEMIGQVEKERAARLTARSAIRSKARLVNEAKAFARSSLCVKKIVLVNQLIDILQMKA